MVKVGFCVSRVMLLLIVDSVSSLASAMSERLLKFLTIMRDL